MIETIITQGEYYRINGTKKILYWDGQRWLKPVKDNRGSWESGLLGFLEKQPTNVKMVERVEYNDLNKTMQK